MALIMFSDCSAGLSAATVDEFDGASGSWSWDGAAAEGTLDATIVANNPPSAVFLEWTHQCGAYTLSSTFDDTKFLVEMFYWDGASWQSFATVPTGVDTVIEDLGGDPAEPLTCGQLLGLQVSGLNTSAAGSVSVLVERF